MAKPALPITRRPIETIVEVLPQQNRFLAQYKSQLTQKTYRSALRLLVDWLQYYEKYPLHEEWPLDATQITADMLKEWSNWFTDENKPARLDKDGKIKRNKQGDPIPIARTYARKTRNAYTAALISYLKFLEDQDYEFLFPVTRLQRAMEQVGRTDNTTSAGDRVEEIVKLMGSTAERLYRYFMGEIIPPTPPYNHRMGTWGEVQYVIPEEKESQYNRRLSAIRDKALFLTLFSSGMRLGEALNVRIKDVQDRSDEFSVEGKGSKTRRVYLPHKDALDAISDYLWLRRLAINHPLRDDDYLFIGHHGNTSKETAEGFANRNKPLSPAHVRQLFVQACQTVGPDLGRSNYLTPHDLRHYFAQRLLDNSIPIDVIQALLGHTSIETTRSVYAPITKRQITRDAVFGSE